MNRLDFASALARDAGKLAHPAFGRSVTTLKGRHDLVTAMDGEVECFIRAAIAARYPDDALIGRVLEAGCAVRRAGSGALGLADVAAGRIEAYCELHINAWDCAAGIVLVREAGGLTNDFFAGDGLTTGNPLLATTVALCAKLADVIGIPMTS